MDVCGEGGNGAWFGGCEMSSVYGCLVGRLLLVPIGLRLYAI